jgi:hypothetical protein
LSEDVQKGAERVPPPAQVEMTGTSAASDSPIEPTAVRGKADHAAVAEHSGAARRLADLADQQRNAMLSEPLAALDSDTNVKGNMAQRLGIDAEPLDLRYTALTMLDHIMEESAFRPGAEYEQVIEVGARVVTRMYQGLDEENAIAIASWVFDQLRNKSGRFGEFETRYFDDRDGVHRHHRFRYIENAFDLDDVNKTWIRLAKGGQKLHLGMFEVGDDMLDDIDRLIIRKAFERNRFETALSAARRSKGRSASFRHDMENLLVRARRNWRSVDWSGSIGPRVHDSIAHLQSRMSEEEDLLRGLDEKIADLTPGGAESKAARELKEEIEDCRRMHGLLLVLLFQAGERFRNIVTTSFAAFPRREARDPESEILIPMLAAPISQVAERAEVVNAAFSAPNPPFLLDLASLFEQLIQIDEEPGRPAFDDEEEIPLPELRPLFAPETLDRAAAWLDRFVEERPEFRLSEAVEAADDAGFSADDLRAVILTFLMPLSIAPGERIPAKGNTSLDFEIGGEWVVRGMGGDDIVFRNIRG